MAVLGVTAGAMDGSADDFDMKSVIKNKDAYPDVPQVEKLLEKMKRVSQEEAEALLAKTEAQVKELDDEITKLVCQQVAFVHASDRLSDALSRQMFFADQKAARKGDSTASKESLATNEQLASIDRRIDEFNQKDSVKLASLEVRMQ